MKVRIAVVAVFGLAAFGVFHSALRAQQTAPSAQQPASASPQESRTVWDGVYTEEQWKRGDPIYKDYCANCHGLELEGMDMSPPLTGPAFTANWNDLSVGDLFERIRISMPQDSPGKLTREQNADVIAYILKVNDFPVGKTELERQVEVLKQIRILATKPDGKE